MPKFLTISPTHVSRKKPYAWEEFKKGNYVSLGWYHTDYSNWTLEKIIKDIVKQKFPNEKEAIDAHRKFYKLEIGDIIAANNVADGLFGIGIIKSDYRFKQFIHDTGSNNKDEFYSHYREVDWVITDYQKRKDLLKKGETCWKIRGTVGGLLKLPDYIKRIFEKNGVKYENNSSDWQGDSELIGYEGEIKEELRLHKWTERDIKFRNSYKAKYAGIKECNGCQLNPKERFGIPAINFLELHHITPLELRKSDKNSITRESDVVLICPNCHKLIHKMMSKRNKKVITLIELVKKIKNGS